MATVNLLPHRSIYQSKQDCACVSQAADRVLLVHEVPEEGRAASQLREGEGAAPGCDLTVHHLRPPAPCVARRPPI